MSTSALVAATLLAVANCQFGIANSPQDSFSFPAILAGPNMVVNHRGVLSLDHKFVAYTH